MKKILLSGLIISTLFSCKTTQPQIVNLPPEGYHLTDSSLENAVIYEVNIRQYSPEGSFNAFTKDIPNLKQLGVKVIWMMPIFSF